MREFEKQLTNRRKENISMKLIKKQSDKTYKSKSGKECHYYNYYLVTDNNTYIQVKASFPLKDNVKLDMVAEYVK